MKSSNRLLIVHGRAWQWTIVAACSVYARSSLHRLAGGDSGELLAEACVGGVAHPPGYPLVLMVLSTVRHIGLHVCPNVAFVALANHLNAIMAAGAAACIAHAVETIVGPEYVVEAVAAGLIFAFSKLTWEYALGLEVFALNNLLCGLILVKFSRHVVGPRSLLNLCIGAFVCGLGLANQHTIVLLEVPLILWIIGTTTLSLRDWASLSVFFIAGLSPYMWLYRSGMVSTPGSWGDTSTLNGLLTHVLRREYGTFRLSPIKSESESLVSRLVYYGNDVLTEFSIPVVTSAVIGLLCAGFLAPQHQYRQFLIALRLTFVLYVVVFNGLANIPLDNALGQEVTRRFFMQPNLLVAIAVGLGLVRIHMYASRVHASIAIVVRATVVSLAAFQFYRHRDTFTTSSIATNDFIRDFGSNVLRNLPPNALLLSYTDIQWNSVRYLQVCEGLRSDVVHLSLQVMPYPWFQRQVRDNRYPSVIFPPLRVDVSTNKSSIGYAAYVSELVASNVKNHRQPIFIDLHGVDESTISNSQLLFGRHQVFPHGLTWRITATDPRDAAQLETSWKAYTASDDTRLQTTESHSVEGIPRGSWEFVTRSIVNDATYQKNIARLGYWLTHSTIKTVEDLERVVHAFDNIQRELGHVVEAGEMISYDRYAVEKNAVVSRQRFQLYLDALGELVTTNPASAVTAESSRLVNQRRELRVQTIEIASKFIPKMQDQQDPDTDAMMHTLNTLLVSQQGQHHDTTHAKQTTATEAKPKKSKKRKKKSKKVEQSP